MRLMSLREQETAILRRQFHARETLMTRCLPREANSVYSRRAGNKVWEMTYRSAGANVIEPHYLSVLAACQTFFTWIPARNSHELLSRHFSTWYGRCGETLCTARMKGAPSCYRYTGIEMENTSPNERLTPGQSQT